MMVAAYGDDERRRLAGEYGAAEFITKPVDFLFKATVPVSAISGVRPNAYEGLIAAVSLSFRDPQISRLRTRANRS